MNLGSVAKQDCGLVLQEAALVQAAELVWQVFAAGSSTAAAAERMLQNVKSSALGSGSCLGHTAWNAYSLNIDYRTGMRIDTHQGTGVTGHALGRLHVPFCAGKYLLHLLHIS